MAMQDCIWQLVDLAWNDPISLNGKIRILEMKN